MAAAARRRSLAELAAKNAADPAPTAASGPDPAAPSPEAGTPTPAETAISPPWLAGGDPPRPGQWARYDQYERKEARVRPDQYGALGELSRALNRARKGSGERITENTLIRVAIDVLLVRRTDLHGATEAELRTSLGL